MLTSHLGAHDDLTFLWLRLSRAVLRIAWHVRLRAAPPSALRLSRPDQVSHSPNPPQRPPNVLFLTTFTHRRSTLIVLYTSTLYQLHIHLRRPLRNKRRTPPPPQKHCPPDTHHFKSFSRYTQTTWTGASNIIVFPCTELRLHLPLTTAVVVPREEHLPKLTSALHPPRRPPSSPP